jgi:hypothetical protein
MNKKRCSKCKEEKLLNEYSPHKLALDGLQSQCRVCMRVVKQACQKKRQAKERAIKLSIRALAPPKRCAIDGCDGKMHGNIWCSKHYKRVLKYGDPLYGEKEKYEKCIITGCNKRTRSGYSKYCETHYYRIRRNGTTELKPIIINLGERPRCKVIREGERFKVREIYERDKWICGLCHKKVDSKLKYPHLMSASLDHIVAIAIGGKHATVNVQLAHLGCNRKAKTGGVKQLRMFG